MLKKLMTIVAIVSILLVCGCSKKERAANEIAVGTISGPETTLMEVAATVAKIQYRLDVNIVPFNDYVLPNQALSDGSIDANMFQHQPYLESAIKAKGYALVAIGKTFIYPMGIYSKKIKNLSDLKSGATVAIPNDPSNQARSLLLLEKAKLITLAANSGTNANLSDVKSNPLKLEFKEMDAAQLPRALDDVSIAAINTNYAMIADLLPSRDALFVESTDSLYANIIVVRTQDRDNIKLKQLVEAMQSKEVQAKAEELFKGQSIPAWRK